MISRSHQARVPSTRKLFGGLALLTLVSAGCTDAAGYDLDYILGQAPFVGTMRQQVSFEDQQMPRLPAPGSVPVSSPTMEVLPPFGQTALDSVGAVLTNPLEITPAVLARGEQVYQNQCFVCHGAQGEGNGPVIGPGKFPLGPTLIGGTALARSDGYVYAIIRVGRGLMPSYGERINHNDRWAVVAYVNQLQQQGGGAAGTAQPATTPAQTGSAPAAVQPAGGAGL